ncbi:MAG: hypothetical protein ACU0GG_15975 [Paracoccaceae bacterium]
MRPYTMQPFAPFFAPLSGDVTQVFRFWSDWFDSVGQIGLVNIEIGNAGNDRLEREILTEVGSYGRQIGQVSDAVAVLIEEAKLKRADLTDEQICALHKFKKMLAKIEDCKEKY